MSDKQKLLFWIFSGVIVSLLLIPTITDAGGIQLYLNLGAFLAIFTGGSTFLILLQWVNTKVRNNKQKLFPNSAILATRLMTLVMILFGLYYYHESIARYHIGNYSYQYTAPSKLNDDWEITSLKDTAINKNLVESIVNRFVKDKAYKKQHSFLMIENSKLVVEEYFYGHEPNDVHDLRSANKSITSILIGIAIDKGLIDSVNDPVYRYFPEYQTLFNAAPNKKSITIKHLLTMSSGQNANDWDRNSPGNENKYYRVKDDWIRLFFELDQVSSPGSTFAYATLGENALRQLLVNVSKTSLDKFADTHLFTPLGISQHQWTLHLPNKPEVPLRVELTSRDFAKLGQLYLNKGKWQGKQIISQKWVNESTQAHIQTNEERLGKPYFGYLWWQSAFTVNGKNITGFRAQGSGGQLMFAFPELDLILVFTSGNFGSERQLNPFRILKNELLPEIVK